MNVIDDDAHQRYGGTGGANSQRGGSRKSGSNLMNYY